MKLLGLERLLLGKINSLFLHLPSRSPNRPAHNYPAGENVERPPLIRPMLFGLAPPSNVLLTVLYLGNIPDGLRMDKADMYLLRVMVAASEKAITKCWLQENAPTTDTSVNKTTA